jgi:hypothetical protein
MRGSGRYAEPSSDFANWKTPGRGNLLGRNLPLWSSELPTLRLGPGEARNDPLLNATALELRDRRQNVELQTPSRRGSVDALAQCDEGNPQCLQFVQKQNQVPEIPSEPVQPPADENIEPPSACRLQQLVKSWPAVLCARDVLVNVFDCRPLAPLGITPEFRELVLDVPGLWCSREHKSPLSPSHPGRFALVLRVCLQNEVTNPLLRR